MVRLILDYAAIMHNVRAVDAMVRAHHARWTLATNALSGDPVALAGLRRCGIRSVADTRVDHMEVLAGLESPPEKWFMRLPHLGLAQRVVATSEVSLVSEMATIAALDAAARQQGRRQAIILMVELGDLSEGIFSGDLLDFYREAENHANVSVLGLGGNLGFQAGVAPNVDRLNQLAMFRELIELKFNRRLPFVSAGTSAVLPLLAGNAVPAAINHFRVGESVFLGTDLVGGGVLPGLRTDALTVEAPVVELKKKTLFYSTAGSTIRPFAGMESRNYSPGQRGYRAVVGIGQADTEAEGLVPVEPGFTVLGAGSDLVVLDIDSQEPTLKVGDTVSFRPGYRALMRLMASPYVEKIYQGMREEGERGDFDLAPVIAD